MALPSGQQSLRKSLRLLAQLEFLDFARRGFRDIAEHHGLGAFKLRQALAAEGDDRVAAALVGRKRRAILERAEGAGRFPRSEEHTSELQSLMRISYAVFSF